VTRREIRLHDLVGRKLRDRDGRTVGRIEELHAEIRLREHGNDYVVTEVHVGTFGALEALGAGHFARALMYRLGGAVGYTRYEIPWEWMDVSDVRRPRVTRPSSEFPRG
jgi:sporulation protein YlmC with PRC-barrel domain